MLGKAIAMLIDIGWALWLAGYAWAYLFGWVGAPSDKLQTLMLFWVLGSTVGTNIRLRTGNYVPANKERLA